MLKVTKLGVKCRTHNCNYYERDWCLLNTKAESDFITSACSATDNWYITGSFVLDKVFGMNTARDIDLVIFEGEKPKKLPSEVLKSPLVIEMLWITGNEPHNIQYHNIALPRITQAGLVGWDIVPTLASKRTLSVLPRIRRLPASTMFWAVKSIVKYDLKMDSKCFQVWNNSFINPIAWRTLTLQMSQYMHLRRDSFDWDMVKASHLRQHLERVINHSTESDKKDYLEKLLEIMKQMDLSDDRGCLTFFRYVSALVAGDEREQKALIDSMRSFRG